MIYRDVDYLYMITYIYIYQIAIFGMCSKIIFERYDSFQTMEDAFNEKFGIFSCACFNGGINVSTCRCNSQIQLIE